MKYPLPEDYGFDVETKKFISEEKHKNYLKYVREYSEWVSRNQPKVIDNLFPACGE